MNHTELLADYLEGMSSKNLAKKYRTELKNIQCELSKMGYTYKDARLRYDGYNNQAFSDWSEEHAAYFYGFILGDGCLCSLRKSIVIGINTKDIDILEKLKSYLGSRNKISTRIVQGKHSVSQFSFSDKEIVNRLIANGLTSRKSTKESIPDNLQYNRHFWRGLIDADGSLVIKRSSKVFTLSLVGSKETAEKFKLFCDTVVGSEAKIRLHSGSKNVYYCTVCGQKSRKIVSLLYKDSQVYLERKYQIADSIKNDNDYLNTKRSKARPLPTRDGRWTMQVGVKGRTVRLGIFDTEEEAISARDAFINNFNKENKLQENSPNS